MTSSSTENDGHKVTKSKDDKESHTGLRKIGDGMTTGMEQLGDVYTTFLKSAGITRVVPKKGSGKERKESTCENESKEPSTNIKNDPCRKLSEGNRSGSELETNEETPNVDKGRVVSNLFSKIGDGTLEVMTQIAPQGIIFHKAKNDELKKHPCKKEAEEESVPKEASDDHRPILITEDRLMIDGKESPSFRLLQMYCKHIVNLSKFREWWTFPILVMFLINPLPMLSFLTVTTGLTTLGSAIHDVFLAVTRGGNLIMMFDKYYNLAHGEWVKFQAPDQRRKYIIVIGLLLRVAPHYMQ